MSRAALLAEAQTTSARGQALPPIARDAAALLELRALRLTIAAALEPDGPEEPHCVEPRWCRVELFGHSVVYGIVTDAVVAGRRFLEVTEPEIAAADGEVVREEKSKRYHPNAVYALEEIEKNAGLDSLRVRAGLHRWRDGTWHADHERVAVELDLDALRDRDRDEEIEREEDDGGEDIPF